MWGPPSLLDGVSLLTFTGLVIGLAGRLPSFPTLARWGRAYSFIIFLSHMATLQILMPFFQTYKMPTWAFAPAAVPMAIIIGMALARGIGHLPPVLAAAISGGRAVSAAPTARAGRLASGAAT